MQGDADSLAGELASARAGGSRGPDRDRGYSRSDPVQSDIQSLPSSPSSVLHQRPTLSLVVSIIFKCPFPSALHLTSVITYLRGNSHRSTLFSSHLSFPLRRTTSFHLNCQAATLGSIFPLVSTFVSPYLIRNIYTFYFYPPVSVPFPPSAVRFGPAAMGRVVPLSEHPID